MEKFGRLTLDRAAERDTGLLRLGAAIVTLIGVAWLATFDLPAWAVALVAIAAAVAVMWVGLYVRARRRVATADAQYLETRPDGLTHASGATVREVSWTEVDAVEVDEDRLFLRVDLKDGEPLVIEPIYGGLGVYELFDAVCRARASGEVQTVDEVRTIGRARP